MKRIRPVFLLGLAPLIFLAGCGLFYEPIAKDAVMVRKIAQVEPDRKTESPGILSEDTVRTLSVNAVNRVFDTNFSLEDVNLELNVFEPKQVKSILYSLRADSDADPLVRYKTELSEIPSGVYSVIVKNRYNIRTQYTVMVNAADGDILDIQQFGENSSGIEEETPFNEDKIIFAARQWLQRLGDIPLDELELGERTVFRDATRDAILFFQNKKTKNTQYVVVIDLSTKEVHGFSKGIATALSYSYLVPAKLR